MNPAHYELISVTWPQLNYNITAIINELRDQNKRGDIVSINKQLIKTESMQDLTKEDILKVN